ncbi:MFS transporter [Spirillospora sp. NPDC050679]
MYALLFSGAGLTPAAISSLFALWSLTTFAFEIPSGIWADAHSRRRLLTLAPLLTATGFALWTLRPTYTAFAAGFVLWGLGSALTSGSLQALVYDHLDHLGATPAYARLMGRAHTLGATATLLATALAAPLTATGGYQATGWASITVCLLTALAAHNLPETRHRSNRKPDPHDPHDPHDDAPADPAEDHPAAPPPATMADIARTGWRQARDHPRVRHALLLVIALTWIGALDEYLPLLARSASAAPDTVPLLILLATLGHTAGGWFTEHGHRHLAPLLALAALCLAAGALSRHPAGMLPVALAYGIFQWAATIADARLQHQITDHARATVTSLAGIGEEAVALLAFTGYALGSTWTGPDHLFAIAAAPYLLLALLLHRTGRPRPPAGNDTKTPP